VIVIVIVSVQSVDYEYKAQLRFSISEGQS
jgi:hypothetical protein